MRTTVIFRTTGWVASLLLLVSLTYSTPAASRTPSIHLLLGNPSAASPNPAASPNNYLLERPQYALSYNNGKKIPNWVSWQLNRSWLGTVRRQNNFRPDESLPYTWYKVTPGDYVGSGYDRGHLAPSGDRTGNRESNSATFLMTNILPQVPDNNQGPWEQLESYCRELTAQGKELYIIAGSAGQAGTLGQRKIAIPASTWKVVVVLDQPGLGLPGITSKTRVIAVNMPNRQGIREQNWTAFLTSVQQLESLTGYNFLSTLPRPLQQTLEAKIDGQSLPEPRQRRIKPEVILGAAVGGSLLALIGYQVLKKRQPRPQTTPQTTRAKQATSAPSAPFHRPSTRAFDRVEEGVQRRHDRTQQTPVDSVAEQAQRDIDLELRILKQQLSQDQDNQKPPQDGAV